MPSASVRPKTEEAPEAPEAPPALPALPPADASDAPAAAPGAVVPWETRFAELAEYKANNGDCNVPVGQGELGRWVSRQRVKRKKAGGISQERIDRLDSINFNWVLRAKNPSTAWETRFDELSTYKLKQGNFKVSRNSVLGRWLDMQTFRFRAGKLSQDRIDALSSIGFDLGKSDNAPYVPPASVEWDTRFNELSRYKEEHGDCRVSARGKDSTLGRWVRTQRANYKDGKIAQGRIDQLNSIGFAFSLKESSPAESWDKRFNELAAYRAEHGNSNIPVNSGKLGRWVKNQRAVYQEGKLAQDRIDRLNSLDFEWRRLEGRGNKNNARKQERKTDVYEWSQIGDEQDTAFPETSSSPANLPPQDDESPVADGQDGKKPDSSSPNESDQDGKKPNPSSPLNLPQLLDGAKPNETGDGDVKEDKEGKNVANV